MAGTEVAAGTSMSRAAVQLLDGLIRFASIGESISSSSSDVTTRRFGLMRGLFALIVECGFSLSSRRSIGWLNPPTKDE
jgi:hypothetical protein